MINIEMYAMLEKKYANAVLKYTYPIFIQNDKDDKPDEC